MINYLEGLKGDFGELIAYEFFKNFALSMLGIFIPILIYSETNSLWMPAVYLISRALMSAVSGFPVMKIINRYSFRSGLYLSYVFLLPAILLIYFMSPNLAVTATVAFLYSIGSTFHSESMRLEFAEDSTREDREMETAELMSIPNIGRFLGPIVGGFASSIGGFQTMLGIALASVLVSLIPARMISLKQKTTELKASELFNYEYLKYVPVFISRGIQAYASVALFSLFTYIFVAGSISSGLVRSLDTVGFMVMAYLSGYISSKYSRSKIILVGAFFAGIVYLLRTTVSTPLEAFMISIAGGLAFKLYDIPLFSNYADSAEDNEERSFYAAEKVFNAVGKSITGFFFLGAFLFYSPRTAFNSVFILAAASTALMVFGNHLAGEK